MEFGVFDHLDLRHGVPLETIYQERLKLISRYEFSGISTYHLAEHHATPLGLAPSPGIFLATVAQCTKTLRFGPMVYCLPLYEPLRLIEEICMLDQISGGRFEFGIGRGISPHEVAYFDINFNNANDIYMEAYEALMTGLTKSKLEYRGNYFKYDSVPMILETKQKPHPPIWCGIGAPKGVKWPAENGYNIISNASCEPVRESIERYKEIWFSNHHTEKILPKMGAARHIYIDETEEKAINRGRRAYTAWHKNFMKLWNFFGDDPKVYPKEFEQARKDDLIITGSPETVREEIREQIHKTSLNYFVCRFAFGDLSYEESMSSLELFGEEISPHIN